jgi:hypothetical protein
MILQQSCRQSACLLIIIGQQVFDINTWTSKTHPQSSRNTPRCPSVVLWTPCNGVEWGACSTIRVWRSGTTCKQPANLAVEGADESLSILSDYTPTVRPPPKRC